MFFVISCDLGLRAFMRKYLIPQKSICGNCWSFCRSDWHHQGSGGFYNNINKNFIIIHISWTPLSRPYPRFKFSPTRPSGLNRLVVAKSVCLYVCPLPMRFSKHRPSGQMLSISRNVRLSVCPSVCVFTFEVLFKRLFAPTSQSRMSNIFRHPESLGKSNGKKWSQILTFLFESCLKLPRKKK